MKKIIGAVLTLAIGFTSCKTDIDVNAPYKDVTIVYGLLNQNDAVHYIKINKAFAGQASVLDMALVRDSSEYNTEDLTVELIEKGGANRTISLSDTVIVDKESGYFYGPEQTVYYTKEALDASDNITYTLKIYNKALDKEVTATTKLVKSFSIDSPGSTAEKKISFADDKGLIDSPVRAKWQSAVNGKRYDVKMVFNYVEVKLNGDTVVPAPLEWIRKGVKSTSTTGGEDLEADFTSLEFYDKIMREIPDDSNVKERWAYSLDFHFYVAGEELNTYMEVTEPSTGLVQDKPEYTNLTNAIGVFSSRYEKTLLNKGLSSGTAKYLKTSSYSLSKNFVKYYNFAGTPQYYDIP